MTFHVGQKVVCVDVRPNQHSGGAVPLSQNTIYTISAIHQCWDGVGLDLYESPVPDTNGRHSFYNSKRFRPVTEKKTETDISCFTDILDRENRKTKIPEYQSARVPTRSGQ